MIYFLLFFVLLTNNFFCMNENFNFDQGVIGAIVEELNLAKNEAFDREITEPVESNCIDKCVQMQNVVTKISLDFDINDPEIVLGCSGCKEKRNNTKNIEIVNTLKTLTISKEESLNNNFNDIPELVRNMALFLNINCKFVLKNVDIKDENKEEGYMGVYGGHKNIFKNSLKTIEFSDESITDFCHKDKQNYFLNSLFHEFSHIFYGDHDLENNFDYIKCISRYHEYRAEFWVPMHINDCIATKVAKYRFYSVILEIFDRGLPRIFDIHYYRYPSLVERYMVLRALYSFFCFDNHVDIKKDLYDTCPQFDDLDQEITNLYFDTNKDNTTFAKKLIEYLR